MSNYAVGFRYPGHSATAREAKMALKQYRAALLESFYDKSKTWYSRTAPSVNSED